MTINFSKWVSDIHSFLELQIEEVAFMVLRIARGPQDTGLFHPQVLQHVPWMGTMTTAEQEEYHLVCAEAVSWLKVQGLLLEASGSNGRSGFLVPGRKARNLDTPEDFALVKASVNFPRDMVHPLIAEASWLLLARGEFSLAVFNAFRQLEVLVRSACSYDDSQYGQTMMRKAFNVDTGPLSDQTQGTSERQSLMELMCGAFGSYKNPHSHRIGEVKDVRDAQEMVMLATHLIRIVETRASNMPAIKAQKT